MKKMNNKGFSLVELIIVIAIMAVLMGVLAPQFLKYVESSRKQKDESAAEEIRNAIEIACSVEKIYNELGLSSGGSTTISYKDGDPSFTGAGTNMEAELESVIGLPVDFTSATHNGQTYTVTISMDSKGVIKVDGDPGEDASGAYPSWS